MMLKRSIFLAGLMTAVSAAGWASSGDGPLDMMLVGRYDCELPGPPPLLVPQPMPDRSFTITGSSGYRAADGSRGQYLYSAGSLVLTTGALRGERYSRRSDNWFYRDATEGSAPGLRCIRKPGSSTNVK